MARVVAHVVRKQLVCERVELREIAWLHAHEVKAADHVRDALPLRPGHDVRDAPVRAPRDEQAHIALAGQQVVLVREVVGARAAGVFHAHVP